MWSHKPGGMPVTNLDASKRRIYDPALSNRNYTGDNSTLDYDTFCGYLCIPRDRFLRIKVGGSKTRKNKH